MNHLYTSFATLQHRKVKKSKCHLRLWWDTHEGVKFLMILRKPRSSKPCSSGAEEEGFASATVSFFAWLWVMLMGPSELLLACSAATTAVDCRRVAKTVSSSAWKCCSQSPLSQPLVETSILIVRAVSQNNTDSIAFFFFFFFFFIPLYTIIEFVLVSCLLSWSFRARGEGLFPIRRGRSQTYISSLIIQRLMQMYMYPMTNQSPLSNVHVPQIKMADLALHYA